MSNRVINKAPVLYGTGAFYNGSIMKYICSYIMLFFALLGISACVDMVSLNQHGVGFDEISSAERIMTKSASSSDVDAYLLIEDGYLEMTDNQYHLTLSRTDARKLGYSVDGYNVLSELIDEINAMLCERIKEWENNPEITTYEITDYTYSDMVEEPQLSLASLQTRSEQEVVMPSGYLTSTDVSHSYVEINGPKEMAKIGGTCFSDPEGYHICHMVETRVGFTVNSATRFGYGYLEVPANSMCTLHYSSLNAVFGSYTWRGLKASDGIIF